MGGGNVNVKRWCHRVRDDAEAGQDQAQPGHRFVTTTNDKSVARH